MNNFIPKSSKYGEMIEVLNDKITLIILIGHEKYPEDKDNLIESKLLQRRVINNIYELMKSNTSGSIVLFYDGSNKYISDLSKQIYNEVKNIWGNIYLLQIKTEKECYLKNEINNLFTISLNDEDNEYITGYYKNNRSSIKNISIDQNKKGGYIIEKNNEICDPWSRDGEIIPIGMTKILEDLINNIKIKISLSYYIWNEEYDINKIKLGYIHPSSKGITPLATHHFILFQQRFPTIHYQHFY